MKSRLSLHKEIDDRHFEEAVESIRKAQSDDDGMAYIEALKRVPKSYLDSDEQFELRREWILARLDRCETPIFGPLIIDIPDMKSVNPQRRDGQTHNFNALPYPGQRRYTLNMWLVRTGGRP